MKRGSIIGIILLLSALLALPVTVSAQALDEINLQGYLTDSGGAPVNNSSLKMRFSLHDMASGGTELWSEEQFVDVNQGIYSVRLGSVNPFPASLDFNSVYYLETGVDDSAGGFEILSPRQPISSVPFARNASLLDGLDSTDFAPASHNHDTLYVGVGQADSVTTTMITDGGVSSADVGFIYAGGTIKGGPAADLDCSGCVSESELDFVPGKIKNVTVGSGLNSTTSNGYVYITMDVPLNLTKSSIAPVLNVTNSGTGIAGKFTGPVEISGYVETSAEYRLGGKRFASGDTASGNTGVGPDAGTGGSWNTFIGAGAGKSNIGFSNTMIGYQAGISSTGGSNVFVGATSGWMATSGSDNTLVGNGAGASISVGSGNTFLGKESGLSNITGNNNTILGAESGYNNTGSNNVFIGYRAGYNETGSDKLYIGNSETNTLIYGDFSTGRVGINTTTPGAALDVNGEIWQRGSQLHADYVFEPDYKLESIDEHAEFMWKNKHLRAIPKASVDGQGREVVMVGAHRRGIVEELEKAHIYIDQLHDRINDQEAQIKKLAKMVEELKDALDESK
jgi:hypothetical protein